VSCCASIDDVIVKPIGKRAGPVEKVLWEEVMKVVRGNDAKREQGGTFTGEASLRRLLSAQQPGGMAASVVHFEDGARTHWHAHPGEQLLYILEGQGRAGTADEEVLVGPGDIVYAAPMERHWHGAAPGQAMTHLSITNVGPAEWFEAPE
jgi:quercetin dioxygenase-like cupin family protein